MKEIVFYNHYHNGDVFLSKPFITDIMSQLDTKYYYAHNNSPKILFDVDCEQFNITTQFPIQQKHRIVISDVIFINTWIGAYFDLFPDQGECNIHFSYKMYELIYKLLNDNIGTNLKIKDKAEYYPKISFDKLELSFQDEFLEKYKDKKKVLISNGPGYSGQCSYNGNMADMINFLASENTNTIFIATHTFDTIFNNVFFTDTINRRQDFDLNEISYISTFCDMIIGRSSGPFTFSIIPDNINNPNKKMICFGAHARDTYIHNMETACDYRFITYINEERLLESLYKEIKDM